MESKSKDTIIADVRRILDENDVTSQLGTFSGETLELNDIIGQSILPAVQFVHMNAPLKMVDGEAIQITSASDTAKLPDKFMRIVSLRCPLWKRALHDMLDETDPLCSVLFSPYPGLSGTKANPAAILHKRRDGRYVQVFPPTANNQITQRIDGKLDSATSVAKWKVNTNGTITAPVLSGDHVVLNLSGSGDDYRHLYLNDRGGFNFIGGHQYYIQMKVKANVQGTTFSFGPTILDPSFTASGAYLGDLEFDTHSEWKTYGFLYTYDEEIDPSPATLGISVVGRTGYTFQGTLEVKEVMVFDTDLDETRSIVHSTESALNVYGSTYIQHIASTIDLNYLPIPEIKTVTQSGTTIQAVDIEPRCYQAILYYIASLVSASLNVQSSFGEVAKSLLE